MISTPSTWVHGWLWLEIYFGQNSVRHFFDPDWLSNHKFDLWWGILQPRRIFRCYHNLNFYVMTLSEHIFLTKTSMDGKHLLRFIKCKRRRQILPHSHSPQTYVAPTKYCTTDTCKGFDLAVSTKQIKVDWLTYFHQLHKSQSAWLLLVNSGKMPLVFTFPPCKYHIWSETYLVFYTVCKSLYLQKTSSQLFTICPLLLDPWSSLNDSRMMTVSTHSQSQLFK